MKTANGNKKRFKWKQYISYVVIALFTIIFSIMSLSGGLKLSSIILLEQISYSVILAISLSLVVGFLGELSLGHAAFMSLGAFFGGYLQTYVFPALTEAAPFVSIILAMLIGGVIAAFFGLIIGLPALRLKGDYLAIVTLAFGEIVKTLFVNSKVFQGAVGLSTFRYDKNTLFIIAYIIILITLAILNNLIKSKHGRNIMAIRDSEIAARAMGVNVTYYKLAVFVISAFFAGVAGVIYSNASYTVKASTFDYNYSINVLVMVVLGGMGNMNGSIIAAVLITFLNNKLATVLTGDLSTLKNMIYALILVLLVIYNNAPKLAATRERFSRQAIWAFCKEKFFKKKPSRKEEEIVAFGADWSKVPTKIEVDAVLSTELKSDDAYVPDRPDKRRDV